MFESQMKKFLCLSQIFYYTFVSLFKTGIMTDTEKLIEKITTCATRVHEELGPGFPERIYQEALVKEFQRSKVEFKTKETKVKMLDGVPHGAPRTEYYLGNIMLELKALPRLEVPHMVLFSNALYKTEQELGLMINFGTQQMQIRTRQNTSISVDEEV